MEPTDPADKSSNWVDALKATQKTLDEFGGQGIIIGGVAVGLMASPRMTQDVDAILLLDIDRLPTLLATAQKNGLAPRISDIVAFAEQARVVLLTHNATDVDISLLRPGVGETVRVPPNGMLLRQSIIEVCALS